MANLPGLTRRGGVWVYRRRVPDNVRALIGKREWKESLNTSDREEAKRLYWDVAKRVQQELDAARQGQAPIRQEHQILRLAQEWFELEFPREKREYTRHIEATFFNPDNYDPRRDAEASVGTVFPFGTEVQLAKNLLWFLSQRGYAMTEHDARFRLVLDQACMIYAEYYPLQGSPAPAAIPHPIVQPPPPMAQPPHNLYAGLKPEAKNPFPDFLEAYFKEKNIEGTTAKEYRRTFKRLEALIGPKAIAEVSPIDVKQFCQSLRVTKSDKSDGFLKYETIKRSISNIRAFYRWAEGRHLAHDNPARKIEIEKDDENDESNI